MLRSLSISNYALIDNLEISFPEGLIIITGETGAGKSILLGALSLLLGARAENSVLRDDKKNCVVEGEFVVEINSIIAELFNKEGIDTDGQIILRRILSPGGKSRSFVNDTPVTVQFLKDLADCLIDIHAQHQHLLLADSNFQMTVFDSFCENSEILTNYRKSFTQYNENLYNVKSLKDQIKLSTQESDYDIFVLNQLKEANLKIDELAGLEEEFSILNSSGEIKQLLGDSYNLFNVGDSSIIQNLKAIVHNLEKCATKMSSVKPLSERLESCRTELRDIENEIIKAGESVDISPERAAQVESRITLIYTLLKKYKKEDVAGLIELQNELENKGSKHEDLLEQLKLAEKKLEDSSIKRDQLALDLRNSRESKREAFSQRLQSTIRELEMPHAIFETEITDTETYTMNGSDAIRFLFSANKNISVKELGKIASGGEVSRIMLCLKTLNAKALGTPTMIFDEIDTGVSGSIADKMGNLLVELSKNLQIFAITHLPQIASKGSTHLLVYKDIDDSGTTNTHIKEISSGDREKEIARMLSGAELTNAAFENARELLKNGNK